jgi:ParB family chromosome partitioning protein
METNRSRPRSYLIDPERHEAIGRNEAKKETGVCDFAPGRPKIRHHVTDRSTVQGEGAIEGAERGARLIAAGSISGKRRTLITALPLERIRPNPDQPRRYFDEQSLQELAASIRERGILQPVIVRPSGDGSYMLLAGERRFRASHIAGLTSIPALVRDDNPLEIAMIENLQRENLTPLEEALGISALIHEHGYTHADVATIVHKSRPHVTNTLALTRLPQSIREEYSADPSVSRDILISVARQKDEESMLVMWRRVKLERLSVKKFRAEIAPEGDLEPQVRQTINAARRLGRRLEALPAGIAGEARARLTRSLRRVRKKIEAFLGTEDS